MSSLVPRPTVGRLFEGQRRVRLADVSPAGRLRLDAAARFLQDLSADDTADAALEDAEAWVVRKTVIEVIAFPRYLEPLDVGHVVLRARAATGLSAASPSRATGAARIEAATTWVHIDMASGRPSRIPAEFDELYGEAHGGRRVKARLDHPDPPDADLDGFAWPLRFTDFDVLGHVNNAACWQIVEQALSERRDLRAPLRAEVQHRTAIERDTTVEVQTLNEDDALHIWVKADETIAMTATVQRQ